MSRYKVSENFYSDEFECRCGCGLIIINPSLIAYLQEIRTIFRSPMKITSGTRCLDHNAKVGGTSSSDHLKGIAVDVACTNAQTRRALLRCVFQTTLPTVGIKKDCVHLSVSLPPRVFTYD